MMGIRTLENDKFLQFFKLVQDKADSMNMVFFLFCGEGHSFEDDNLEGENLSGWLIPKDRADEFNQKFIEYDSDLDDWDDFFAFAEWKRSSNDIIIDIYIVE
ncbi:MAG: hypothetical protein HFE63_01020 [Clostridiales bacterium]|nr:hypothetical protein [Clostridiales bacterium]